MLLRGVLAACTMSMCHGVATSALATWQLAASLPFALDQPNNAAQEAILQLSTVLPMTHAGLACGRWLT